MAKAPKSEKKPEDEILGKLPDELRVDGPGADNAGADDTGADNAGADDTGADNAGADDTGADNAGADDIGADNAGADDTGADKVSADDTGADKVSADDTGVDNTGADGSDNNQEKVDTGLRDVVVLKGNTIRHNGHNYGEFSKITMDEADAERVKVLGIAEDLQTFRKKSARRAAGVVISGD